MSVRALVTVALLAGALWLVPGSPALAVDCTVKPTSHNVLGDIDKARALSCYGGDQDSDPLTKQVLAIKTCDADSRDGLLAIRAQIASAAGKVETQGESLVRTAPDSWRIVTESLLNELRLSEKQLQDIEQISAAAYWDWHDEKTLQQPDGHFLVDYGTLIQASCPAGGKPENCEPAIAAAVNIIRLVDLSHYLHQCAGNPRLNAIRKRLSQLDAEWNSYFFKTRSQYVWELALNSARFKAKDDVFAEPPPDQIILAHPGVAFEYVGSGAGHDKSYEPIVMAEVLGYNRFRWPKHSDGSLSALPPLGASLVATYSPDNVGKHVGFGVMMHVYNTYSFGVTRRDTGAGMDTTYMLSADLMRLFLRPSSDWIMAFRPQGIPAAAADRQQ